MVGAGAAGGSEGSASGPMERVWRDRLGSLNNLGCTKKRYAILVGFAFGSGVFRAVGALLVKERILGTR